MYFYLFTHFLSIDKRILKHPMKTAVRKGTEPEYQRKQQSLGLLIRQIWSCKLRLPEDLHEGQTRICEDRTLLMYLDDP